MKIDYIIQWQPKGILAPNDWGLVTNGACGGEVSFDDASEAIRFVEQMQREDKKCNYRVMKRNIEWFWGYGKL